MTEKEIQEGNKLIATFMGKTIQPQVGTPEFSRWKGEAMDYSSYEVAYHSSWDWLIPVVEKINVNTEQSDERENFKAVCQAYLPFGSINYIWKASVKFIKWYNTQPSNKEI